MKHIFTLLLSLTMLSAGAQFALVGWTFPDDSKDLVADTGVAENLDREITTFGGTSAIEFKNGYEDNAAQASGWDNGALAKGWEISFTTLGYYDIHFTSRQTSGGNDPGPRYWMVQYKIGEGGTWTDVENSGYELANDWTTGYIEDLVLPQECGNQELVSIRWIVTDNESTGGGAVEPTGKSKIDNILVLADAVNDLDDWGRSAGIAVGPIPADGHLDISWPGHELHFMMNDMTGRVVGAGTIDGSGTISLDNIPGGIYILRFSDGKNSMTRKIVVNN